MLPRLQSPRGPSKGRFHSDRCAVFLPPFAEILGEGGRTIAQRVLDASRELVGFGPQHGQEGARARHLSVVLQPTEAWMVMIGVLIWMHRELAHMPAHAPTLAIASRPK